METCIFLEQYYSITFDVKCMQFVNTKISVSTVIMFALIYRKLMYCVVLSVT